MRSFAVAALLLGAAVANPVPQDWDLDAIDAAVAELAPAPTADVPVVDAAAQATTISYSASAVASAVASAILANPTDVTPDTSDDSSVSRRDTADTAANWAANTQWASDANSAAVPSGYNAVFTAQTASANAVVGYMGFKTLSSYNVQSCANSCTNMKGCTAFNIYYERDPSTDPTSSNPNPPSTTVVKCVWYGGVIDATMATNSGQYRQQFQVVIGGSNAYQTTAVVTPPGYTLSGQLTNAAINAPADCNGWATDIPAVYFDTGVFDVNRCAVACNTHTGYALAHPPTDGSRNKLCQYFNTYVLYKNGAAQSQVCQMYAESWAPAFAVNNGQTRGTDKYTIKYSFAYSNTTLGLDKPVGCTNPTKPQ